jgi:hypothetical protein
MTTHRRWPRLGILLALIAAVSCRAGDLGGPSEGISDPVSQRMGERVPLVDTLSTANLLLCSPERYLTATKLVGSGGGKIKVGSHVLTIPAGALSQDVTITAEQLTGSVNSVRFSPEGLTFALPAELTMSYTNCTSVISPKRVVYTDEQLKILELLRSVDRPQTKTVTSPIDHFSRYAVAY